MIIIKEINPNGISLLNLIDKLESNEIDFLINEDVGENSFGSILVNSISDISNLLDDNNLTIDSNRERFTKLDNKEKIISLINNPNTYFSIKEHKFHFKENILSFREALKCCRESKTRKSHSDLYLLIRDIFHDGILSNDFYKKEITSLYEKNIFKTIKEGSCRVKFLREEDIKRFKDEWENTPRVTTWESNEGFGVYLPSWKLISDPVNLKKTFSDLEIVEGPDATKLTSVYKHSTIFVEIPGLDEGILAFKPKHFRAIVKRDAIDLKNDPGLKCIPDRLLYFINYYQPRSDLYLVYDYFVHSLTKEKKELVKDFLIKYDFLEEIPLYDIDNDHSPSVVKDVCYDIVEDIKNKTGYPLWLFKAD